MLDRSIHEMMIDASVHGIEISIGTSNNIRPGK
jgi:hypothetical protein